MNPILLIVFVVTVCVFIYNNRKRLPENFPPGPTNWPIWGGYLQIILENYRLPHRAIHNMAKRYNTTVVGAYFGDFATAIACDWQTVREVLTRPEFQGRVDAFVPRYRGDGERLGVIFSEGDFWIEQRRFMLRNLRDFGFGRRSDVFESKLEDEIKDLIEMFRNGDQPFCKGGVAKLPQSFLGSYSSMGIQMICGDRKPFSEAYRLADILFQQNKKLDATTGTLNITPWTRFFAPETVGFTATKISTEFSKDFLQNFINDHKAHLSDDTSHDFMDRYLQEMKRQGNSEYSSFSENQLTVIGMDMLFAASVTASNMTSFIFYFLAKNQHALKKCQIEIDEVVGKNKLPTLNDRQNLPYTEASIKEAMRCQTLVPLGVPHRATEDTKLGGYFIPKGTMVLTNLYSAHQDESVFDKPHEYRPERFLEPDGSLSRKDLSVPFGLGKRVCAGETFARQNIFLTVSSLIQNFNFKEDPSRPFPSLDENLSGLNESPKPFWIKVEPRF